MRILSKTVARFGTIVKRSVPMARPKLSIIIPCYKVEKYLPKCLDSLVNQTMDDIELVCINDGSPDSCLEILKDYQEKYGEKIVIIDKKNEGVWIGRQDGIKKAHGEYIGFVDSDDYVHPEFAEKLYNAAVSHDADIAVCGFERIDLETGKIYSREMCKARPDIDSTKNPGAMLELNGAPWNKVFRADLLKKNFYQMKNVPKVLDDMMFQLLVYYKTTKITFIPDSLVYYMVRKDSIINTVKMELIPSTYAAMVEVRELYARERPELLDYIDANAFLHLGVSFVYRLSENPDVDLMRLIRENQEFLNQDFPRWKKTPYTTLGYVLRHHGANLKLWIVKVIINLGLFRWFIKTYKFMIRTLGVDIKW